MIVSMALSLLALVLLLIALRAQYNRQRRPPGPLGKPHPSTRRRTFEEWKR